MRIDIEYMYQLIERTLDHNKPEFTLKTLEEKIFDDESLVDNLVFHVEILRDQGLLEGINGSYDLGIKRSSGGNYVFSMTPLRLTASGHDFASALAKPGIIETLKTTFNELGPSETVKATFKLGAKALDTQLSKLLED